LSRDEALATLTKRFFSSHGPATVRDFVWWSGLTTADAKRGLEIIKATREELGGRAYWTAGRLPPPPTRDRPVHLLPIYDEYIVAYRDREAVPHTRLGPGRSEVVIFQHALVAEGQIVGTWRTTPAGRGTVTLVPLRPLKRGEQRAVAEAVGRYERFVGGQ
jgi:Winged helix DNA-binding domain